MFAQGQTLDALQPVALNCGKETGALGEEHPMVHWLGLAAKQLREEGEKHQVDVAAAHDPPKVTQGTISRFEAGQVWPKGGPERRLRAYAKCLEIDEGAIWERAWTLRREAED